MPVSSPGTLSLQDSLLSIYNLISGKVSFTNEIEINQPVDVVYNFLSDSENIPKWNYYVLSVTKTSPGEIGVGTTYHQVRKKDAQDFKIVELNYPDTIAIESLPPYPRFNRRFTIVAQGNNMLLTDTWKIDVPFFLSPFIKGKVKNAVAANLEKLKTLLELGSVQLQDGRVVILD